MANSKPLRLYSHATGPKWIPPDPETDHFCSRGTVPFMNRRPDRTGMSKWAKQLFLAVLLVLKGTGPGVYTVSDSFGKETASKLDLLFRRSRNQLSLGMDWRWTMWTQCLPFAIFRSQLVLFDHSLRWSHVQFFQPFLICEEVSFKFMTYFSKNLFSYRCQIH